MNDPRTVRLVDRVARLDDVVDGDRNWQGAFVCEEGREITPFEVFYHLIRSARFEPADVGYAGNVLATQPSCRPGFTKEAFHKLFILQRLVGHKLERDQHIELLVPRSHDDSHTSRAENPLDPVLSGEHVPSLDLLVHSRDPARPRGHS